MSYPPKQRRRRLLRGAPAYALAGLAVFGGGGSLVYWQDTRFPSHLERLSGTPVELRVQAGVESRELQAIRYGMRAGDRFMRRTLRRTVRHPVEARIAHGNGCRPFQASGGALVGEGEDGFMCIDTSTPGWQWLVSKDLTSATALAAHEYVHVLQAEIGCLPPPGGQQFRWIIEGMASEIGWRALVKARRATVARVNRTIVRDGALDPNLERLVDYERDGGRNAEYAFWHLAAQRLLKAAVRTGAAPASRPEVALVRFCARVADRQPWRAAFKRSFGLPPARFYARFESARARGALITRRERLLNGRWLW
jgi:hypothetical protein